MRPQTFVFRILVFLMMGMVLYFNLQKSLEAQTTNAQQWSQLYEGMSSSTSLGGEGAVGNLPLQQSRGEKRIPQQVDRQAEIPSAFREQDTSLFKKIVISDLEKKLQPQLNQDLVREQPLKQFGYDQLRADRFQFDPIANPSLPRNYFLGPGDEVLIHDSLGKSAAMGGVQGTLVDPSGLLHIPGVEPIKAWDLTLEQLNKELRARTKFLYATLGRLRSIQVNLIGEASRPGLHRVPAIASIYNVLALAGGVKKSGSLRRIQWKRGNKLVAEIDLYDYLLQGESEQELTLKSGDTLFIPLLKNAVAMAGAVLRPGIYEIQKEVNLKQGIELAGGLQPEIMGQIQIERTLPGQPSKLIRVFLADPDSGRQKLENHDVVKVFPGSRSRTVKISGEVIQAPGNYPMLEGMNMSDLVQAAGGLDHPESTDFTVFITRWEYSDTTSQRIIYKIRLDSQTLKTKPEFSLKHGDAVLIRHHGEYRQPSFVTVAGEVRFPGTYEFILGDRLSDVIQKAGGFTKEAFLEGAVFTRKALVLKESAVDMRLRKDAEHGLLQSTIAASSSLTSPQIQLQALSAIRQELNETELNHAVQIQKVEKAESAKLQDINLGRLIIQLRPISEFMNTVDDVELADGDVLTIPTKSNTILVKGETLGEASLPYKAEEELDYYIDQLGGLRDSADLDDVYVIKASGIVVKESGYDIRPGDTIIAPPDLRPKESTLMEYATFVDIIFKTLTTLAVLYSIGILQAPSAIGMFAF